MSQSEGTTNPLASPRTAFTTHSIQHSICWALSLATDMGMVYSSFKHWCVPLSTMTSFWYQTPLHCSVAGNLLTL